MRAGFARILKQEEFAMPVITFDKEHLDEGFMYLSRRGEVGCLPNDLFVITDALFELLQKSRIPFIQVDNHQITQQGTMTTHEVRPASQVKFLAQFRE
jgi:hypothetical protein